MRKSTPPPNSIVYDGDKVTLTIVFTGDNYSDLINHASEIAGKRAFYLLSRVKDQALLNKLQTSVIKVCEKITGRDVYSYGSRSQKLR